MEALLGQVPVEDGDRVRRWLGNVARGRQCPCCFNRRQGSSRRRWRTLTLTGARPLSRDALFFLDGERPFELFVPRCLTLDLLKLELIDEVVGKQNVGTSAKFREGVKTVSGRF